jgi:hypothetical protein
MTDVSGRADRQLLGPAAVLSAGILLAALVFGLFFHSARQPERTVSVVGAATRSFEADRVKWRLSISRQVGDQDLPGGFDMIRDDVASIRSQLTAAGLPDSALTLQPPSAQPQYSPQGGRSGYSVVQPLYVLTGDIERVEAVALEPGRILTPGMALEYSQLEYFYDGIAELKHALLADATRDAKRRAEEIAGSTDGRVGAMVTARAGVFQITEPYSTEVAGYGIHNTATRKKEITVTVHGEFRIR